MRVKIVLFITAAVPRSHAGAQRGIGEQRTERRLHGRGIARRDDEAAFAVSQGIRHAADFRGHHRQPRRERLQDGEREGFMERGKGKPIGIRQRLPLRFAKDGAKITDAPAAVIGRDAGADGLLRQPEGGRP